MIVKFEQYNESITLPDLKIVSCDKSKESYNFVSKHLDMIDYESYINNENLYQICVYDKDKLVGVSIFRMKDGKIHMNYSSVDVDYRNKGINKKMKMKIIDIGRKNDCSIITSNVRASNLASLKSQLDVGFQINDKVDLTYPDGEKKLPLYLRLK